MESFQSKGGGFIQMLTDIFDLLLQTLTTKFGLIIFLICLTIYFFSLWMCGGLKWWGLVISILTLLMACILSYYNWFVEVIPIVTQINPLPKSK
jgi:sorbitol-specific phosphotransferase system component IIC